MATRTVSNAGGNWGTLATWIEGLVPTQYDDVVCTPTSGNLTVNSSTCACRSANFTGYTGTLAINSGSSLSVYGDLTMVAGMTFAPSSTTQVVKFKGAVNPTLISAGKNFAKISVELDEGYHLILSDTLNANVNTMGGLFVASGGLDTNDQTMNLGVFDCSTTANTVTVDLGASAINIAGGSACWNCGSSYPNLTLTCGTSVITFSDTSSFYGGGKTYNNVVFNGGSTSIRGSNTFASIVCAAGQNSFNLGSGTTTTVTGTLTVPGGSATDRVTVCASTTGAAATLTLTGATVTFSYANFRDITFTTAIDLSAITGLSGDMGGNTNATFTTAATLYWHMGAVTDAYWTDSGHWFTATNGGGSAGRIPLPQDTSRFDANSFDGTGCTVRYHYVSGENMILSVGQLDCTGSTAFSLTGRDDAAGVTVSIYLYGNVVLNTGVTVYGASLYFFGTVTAITLNGGSLAATAGSPVYFYGSVTLSESLSFTNNYLMIGAGTLFDANDFNVTGKAFTISGAGTINMGSGHWIITRCDASNRVWYCTHTGTLNCETSTIEINYVGSVAPTFYGGGKTYYNMIVGTNTNYLTIRDDNTFNVLTITAPREVRFYSGSTQTVASFVANGTAANPITLRASTVGSHFHLSDSAGTNTVTWCTIQDSTAQGGATWAATNSTDVSGNSGWNITASSGGIGKGAILTI